MLKIRTDRMCAAAGVLLLFSMGLGAGASVFKVLGPNWSGWVPTGGLPWERAYRTAMTVNGKPVELQVFTARYNQPVEAQLKAALESIGARVNAASSGASGVATLNEYEVRYVVSSPPSDPRTYIFLSYSRPGTTARQEFPVALYPGGKVLSTVSDTQTRTDYATVSTTDSSTMVHEYYRGLLTSEGWGQVKPCQVDSGESRGLAVYAKKGKICFIDVVRGNNISNTVTVLVEKAN